MISFFKRKLATYGTVLPLQVDMHSHLLFGIDDGCQTLTESVELVKKFVRLGYKKLIITPHVMGDFYRNTPEIILDRLDKLNDIIRQLGLDIELEAAAEYYLDESFIQKLDKEEPLLSFGKKKYLLFETSYINPSPFLDSTIFRLKALGYQPVLAHPERYVYLFDDYNKLLKIQEKGVLLQVNINSLSGYYSKPSMKIAEKLIDDRLVSFLGSDCHNEKHYKVMEKTRESSYYTKALKLELLNNTLLTN